MEAFGKKATSGQGKENLSSPGSQELSRMKLKKRI